jgi:hypothetical protein
VFTTRYGLIHYIKQIAFRLLKVKEDNKQKKTTYQQAEEIGGDHKETSRRVRPERINRWPSSRKYVYSYIERHNNDSYLGSKYSNNVAMIYLHNGNIFI